MRTSDRDRCRSAIAALCAALVIVLIVPLAGALSADYQVFPNGTAYTASLDITDVSRYEFSDVGMLGENVPLAVDGVRLFARNGSEIPFNRTTSWSSPSTITFDKGNYTVTYIAPLRDNHLQGAFDKPYNVSVRLPAEFDVRNPLLASMSLGANVTHRSDNTTYLVWNKTASFDLRFYDHNRESLLFMFGEFWLIIAVVLLIPFLMIQKRQ
ncbi:MAG: DUF5803 family protein [Methanoregula sp.]